jgi:hypothetical protein
MRKESDGKFWVMQATSGMVQQRWNEVDAATQQLFELAVAQERPQFEVGGLHDMNIYFAAGDKVYSYSTTERRSIEVLHRPGSEITYLRFTGITNTGELAGTGQDIMVGTFDGQYGLLEQFNVPQSDPFVNRGRSFGINENHGGVIPTPSVRLGKIVSILNKQL